MELDFVEREATPALLMKLGIRLHLAGLSLSNTVSELDRFGVDRSRSTVHNWVQKAGLQPEEGRCPDHVALDETVIQVDDQQYWLYAAIDPETNAFLHVALYTAQNLGASLLILQDLKEKHDVSDVPRTVQFSCAHKTRASCERRVSRRWRTLAPDGPSSSRAPIPA